MTIVLVVSHALLVILANFVPDVQSRNGKSSWNVIQTLEYLSELTENLQTKMDLQASLLNNLVTKEELQTLTRNLETKAERQATLLTSLVTKEELEANELNKLQTEANTQTTLLNNLNAKDEKQATLLSNLEAQSNTQANVLEKLNTNLEMQATSLNNLVAKAESQEPSLNNLQAKADAQANLLHSLVTNVETQATLLSNVNAKQEAQSTSLDTLEAQSKAQETLLNKLDANMEKQANLTDNMEAKAEQQETMLRNLETKADTQANMSNNLATKEQVEEILFNTLLTKSVMQAQGTSLSTLESKVDSHTAIFDNMVTKEESQRTLQNFASNIETVDTRMEKLSEYIQNSGPFKANDRGIIAGTTAGVVVISLDSGEQRTISSKMTLGVAFDFQTRQVYWIEDGVGIKRANLHGTPVELVVPDTSELWGLAVDPITGNIYYGVRPKKEIRVCSRSGINCAVVASGGAIVGNAIYDIALDPSEGIMIWYNLESKKNVIRSNMDGTNATVIISEPVYGICVDEDSHRLAWANDDNRIIASTDFGGSNRKVLLNATLSPHDVAIDGNTVYFGNWNDKSLSSVTPDGRRLFIASTAGKVRYIALYGKNKVYSRPNPCQNSPCRNVCVLNPNSHTCL